MSEEQYGKNVIKEFLKEVELKLPIWLKGDPQESANVLKELEEHIEDKVEALEAAGKSRAEAVHIAISEMGSPSKIAREYRKRGTPKLYITEELWPSYLTVLKYGLLAIVLINVIITVIGAITAGLTGLNWGTPILRGLGNLFYGCLLGFVIISAIFVWLSYEGIFPEDFRKLTKKKEAGQIKPQPQKQPPKTRLERLEAEKKPHYPKGVEKRSDLIAGGIFTLIVAIFAISQPFTELNALLNPEFLILIQAIGVFWLVSGVFEIVHSGFISWSFNANRALYPIRAIVSLASISILALFLMRPEICPIFWWNESGLVILSIAPQYFWIYYLVLSLAILGMIIGAIHKIYRAVVLEEAEFFEA